MNTSSLFHDSDLNPSDFSPFSAPSTKSRSPHKVTMLSVSANDANESRKKVLTYQSRYIRKCEEEGTAPSSCIVRNICKEAMPLSNLLLGDSGVNALVMSITPTLTDLDLSSNGLTSSSLLILSPYLPVSSITSLNLARNSISDAGASSLFQVLRYSKLRNLCLSGNKIGDAGVQGLLERDPDSGSSGLAQPPEGGVDKKEASKSPARGGGTAGSTKLADQPHSPAPPVSSAPPSRSPRASLAYVEPPLEVLNLSSNHLTPSGFQAVSSFLSDGPFRLRRLDLSWNTGGDDGCLSVANALGRRGAQCVESLNLAFNGITDGGGARIFYVLAVMFGGEVGGGGKGEEGKGGKKGGKKGKRGTQKGETMKGKEGKTLKEAFKEISTTLRQGGEGEYSGEEGGGRNLVCSIEGVEMTLESAISKLEVKHGQTLSSVSSHLFGPHKVPSKAGFLPALTHLGLSRNRLGPLSCLALLRMLVMPACVASRVKRKRVKMRVQPKLTTSRRAERVGGGGAQQERQQVWAGKGCTITHLDVGFNPLGGEGTDVVVKARGTNVEVLRIENTNDGEGGVGIEGTERGGGSNQEEGGVGEMMVEDGGVTVTEFPGVRRAVNPRTGRGGR
ncbi:hypothetical protein TrRE_jg11343 [Triparma retinervis]|uniref:Uncharacterized protein n=1 Tax=Triparma retinervis TaxID=2557542 RepID=A0A9W7DPT3_9STRA|nr:hypothetical protein TrRE_jg11343 [Triparma retinervis]